MKFLIIMFLIPTFAFAFPQNGTYRCLSGNKPSICDQTLKVFIVNNVLRSISVLYDGDCGGQGPYLYDCQDNFCMDQMGMIVFELKDEAHYRWENKQYGFVCEFGIL